MAEINMYDNILSQAFHEYMNERLESDVYREDEFKTSESFDKKMSKMIKSEHNVYHKVTLTRARKVLLIAAIIVVLLLSSLSVGAVRNLIANFFVQHFSTHDTIKANLDEGVYPTKLEEVYELGEIPDGYELVDEDIINIEASYIYSNGKESILFEQITKNVFKGNFDNERSKHTLETHNGQEYYVINYDTGNIEMIWDNGEYIFDLSAKLPKETMFDLCESLKIK